MNSQQHLLTNNKVEIDLRFVYEICGDSTEDVERIVGLFLKNIPATVEHLQLSSSANELHLAAHAAKSALSVIKIPVLYKLLLQIEKDCKNPEAKDHIKILTRQCSDLYIEVQSLLHDSFKSL